MSDFKESIVDTSNILFASSISYFCTSEHNHILASDSESHIIASSYLTVIGICFLFSFFNIFTLFLWSI